MTRYFTKPQEVEAYHFKAYDHENRVEGMPERLLARRGEWFFSSWRNDGRWEAVMILGPKRISVPIGHWAVIWPDGTLEGYSPEVFALAFDSADDDAPPVAEWDWPVSGIPGITPIKG